MAEVTLVKLPSDNGHWTSLMVSEQWFRNGSVPPATSHYLSQCWPISMSPYGVTTPKWVNHCCVELILQNIRIYLYICIIFQYWVGNRKLKSFLVEDKCPSIFVVVVVVVVLVGLFSNNVQLQITKYKLHNHIHMHDTRWDIAGGSQGSRSSSSWQL